MTELTEKRSYSRKVFDAGGGKKLYRFHLAHKHYKDSSGIFLPIDTTLSFNASCKVFTQNKASYACGLPEYADGAFEFYNAFEGADHFIRDIPQCAHVMGLDYKDESGMYVLYKNAFGPDIDLKVYAYWAGLKKVIVINKKPFDTSKDLVFDFELQIPITAKILSSYDIEWDKAAFLDFKESTIRIGDNGRYSYFLPAHVWDSGEMILPVEIQLYIKNFKLYLRKTIKPQILEKAFYPLYTDHPTSYYVGAGDGDVRNAAGATWAAVHDATSGDIATYGNANQIVAEAYTLSSGTSWLIKRGFFPIDTSGIADTDNIDTAALNLYVYTKNAGDNDGDDWINVVQASQASTSSIVVGDFDQCGAVSNPTEGSTRKDISSDITINAYNAWTLNATGIGWVNKTGFTLLGVREGHDAINSVVATGADNYIGVRMSEYTGTTSDPYLDVTTSAGGGSLNLSVYESLSIAEGTLLLIDKLLISLSDSVSIQESIGPLLDKLLAALQDSIATTDSTDPLLPLLLKSISDNIATNESASPLIPVLLQSLYDAVTATEAVSLMSELAASLYENISIAENVDSVITLLVKTLYENVTVSENLNPLVPLLLKSLFDGVFVSENTNVGLDILCSIYDNLSVTENISPLIPTLIRSIADNITVSDSVNPLVPTLLSSLFESIAVAESAEEVLPLLLKSLSENIAVAESVVAGGAVGTCIVFDDANGWLSVFVKGVEVARFKQDGSLDVNASTNPNAF